MQQRREDHRPAHDPFAGDPGSRRDHSYVTGRAQHDPKRFRLQSRHVRLHITRSDRTNPGKLHLRAAPQILQRQGAVAAQQRGAKDAEPS
jgi:hypothetical protein